MEGTGMVGVVGIASRLFGTYQIRYQYYISHTRFFGTFYLFWYSPNEVKQAQRAVEEEFRYEMFNNTYTALSGGNGQFDYRCHWREYVERTRISGKMFKALGKNGINVKAIAQGSSELNITAVIDK